MPKPLTDASPAPVAFSYIRFSHPDQAKGDSVRRQAEAAREWCERNKIKLDTSTTFRATSTAIAIRPLLGAERADDTPNPNF